MDSHRETNKKAGIDNQQNRWLDAAETLTEAQIEIFCERFIKLFIEPFEIKNNFFQVNLNYKFFCFSLITVDNKKYDPKYYEKTNSLLTNSNLKSIRTKLKNDFFKQNPNMKFRHALETGLICDIRDFKEDRKLPLRLTLFIRLPMASIIYLDKNHSLL